MQARWQPSASDGHIAGSLLDGVIQRLEDVVDEETTALRAHGSIDLNAYNNRKSQGLLELNRALRTLDPTGHEAAVSARLSRLREKLDANRMVLKMHLDAVREITGIMADAIREAESDGTYTQAIHGGGRTL